MPFPDPQSLGVGAQICYGLLKNRNWISTLFASRNLNESFTDEQILQFARKTKSFDICVTWCYDLVKLLDFLEAMCLESGSARVLVIDPKSRFVKKRAKAIGHNTSTKIKHQINSDIGKLVSLKKKVSDRLKVRSYKSYPTSPVFITDEYVLAGWLLNGFDFRDAPSIRISRKEPSAECFVKHFDLLWRANKKRKIC